MSAHFVIRPRAVRDIDDHTEYLARNASVNVALRFQQMLEELLADIKAFPEMGAPWESTDATLTGMRYRILRRFNNHVVFFRTTDDHIEIVRVLHASQDLETHLREEYE